MHMLEDELNNEYFEWMYKLVCNKNSKRISYRKLLMRLHCIDFEYKIAMDSNREQDGIDLKYRFGYEHSYSNSCINIVLPQDTCSVLEMIVALSIRCDEQIMFDPEIGDRTGIWFWIMIDNLGLGAMNDQKFDKTYTDMVIKTFLDHEYKPNGKGGLFRIDNCEYDLRTVEIWYQMCWYLNSIE